MNKAPFVDSDDRVATHSAVPDKHSLVFETVQQAHDVPFGSYFEAFVVVVNGCFKVNYYRSTTSMYRVGTLMAMIEPKVLIELFLTDFTKVFTFMVLYRT
nr:hypothetical protein [Tanacetum cinerariifolium]